MFCCPHGGTGCRPCSYCTLCVYCAICFRGWVPYSDIIMNIRKWILLHGITNILGQMFDIICNMYCHLASHSPLFLGCCF